MKRESETPEAGPRPDVAAAGAALDRPPAGRDSARKLKEEIRLLREELQSLYSSPAWRLIFYYRRWLRRTAEHWPGLHHLYASLADRLALRFSDSKAAAGAHRAATALYHGWIQETEPIEAELELQRELSRQLSYQPLISVLLPVFRVPLSILRAAVDSVCRQTYTRWELCLVHGDPDDAAAREYVSLMSQGDPRIKVRLLDSNLGISGNSNVAISMATGEFIALLDHDDTLAPFALFEVASVLNERQDLDFLYSDSDEMDESGEYRLMPFLKPGWSRTLMLCANYVTHLSVVRTQLARQAGGFRPELDGAQDWDFFLRVAGDGSRVAHIAKVLYHWRRGATSVAGVGLAAKPYAAAAQMGTLASHFKAAGKTVEASRGTAESIHLRWVSEEKPAVSIVLVSAGFPASSVPLAERLAKRASSDMLEIVVPVCGGAPRAGSRVVVDETKASQSTAQVLNQAAARCRGDAIVFLDRSLAGADGWLREIVGPIRDRDTGAAGAMLLDFWSGRIRHAGIVFEADGEARNLFAGMEEGVEEPFGSDCWYRDVLALSGACFSIRRDVFLRVGGFHAAPRYPRLDIDLCLRLRLEEGLGIMCNPFARMTQNAPALLETWLRPYDECPGAAYVRALFPRGDPFFNPNLSHRRGSIQLRSPRTDPPPSSDGTTRTAEASKRPCAAPGTGSVERST